MSPEPVRDVEHAAEHVFKTLWEDITGSDGYLVVLILTLVSVVMIPIDETFRLGPLVTALLLGFLVLVTLTRSHVGPMFRRLGLLVVTMSVVVATAVVVHGHATVTEELSTRDRWLTAAAAMSYCLVLALCFPAILRRAFAHRTVTLNTVAAALSAYLLIGIIFTSLFRFVNIVDGPFFVQSGVTGFTFEYFSFITLTTVGYGDFTAASNAGRTLAMLEALLGQVFLVTIVAMVVANLGQEHARLIDRPRNQTPTADDPFPVTDDD